MIELVEESVSHALRELEESVSDATREFEESVVVADASEGEILVEEPDNTRS